MENASSETADFARSVFSMYREHGLGQFSNWLTLKKDNVHREEVVESLRFPETRRLAEKLVEFYKLKIDELESMLEESESASS